MNDFVGGSVAEARWSSHPRRSPRLGQNASDGVKGGEVMMAVVPDWFAVGAQQVLDCSRLATDDCHRLRAAGGSSGNYEAGVASAIAWALGASPSLVSDHGGPVDRAAAEAEFFATGEVELGRSPRGATVPADAAQGMTRTLAWLLGLTAEPPVPIPRRPVPSAEELFAERIAAEPHRDWLPEDRNMAWVQALADASRLAALAARADSLA